MSHLVRRESEGTQTLLSCASKTRAQILPTIKRYVECAAQTIVSYDPRLSDTNITIDIKCKIQDHSDNTQGSLTERNVKDGGSRASTVLNSVLETVETAEPKYVKDGQIKREPSSLPGEENNLPPRDLDDFATVGTLPSKDANTRADGSKVLEEDISERTERSHKTENIPGRIQELSSHVSESGEQARYGGSNVAQSNTEINEGFQSQSIRYNQVDHISPDKQVNELPESEKLEGTSVIVNDIKGKDDTGTSGPVNKTAASIEVQTFFTYNPILSISDDEFITDELTNCFPEHIVHKIFSNPSSRAQNETSAIDEKEVTQEKDNANFSVDTQVDDLVASDAARKETNISAAEIEEYESNEQLSSLLSDQDSTSQTDIVLGTDTTIPTTSYTNASEVLAHNANSEDESDAIENPVESHLHSLNTPSTKMAVKSCCRELKSKEIEPIKRVAEHESNEEDFPQNGKTDITSEMRSAELVTPTRDLPTQTFFTFDIHQSDGKVIADLLSCDPEHIEVTDETIKDSPSENTQDLGERESADDTKSSDGLIINNDSDYFTTTDADDTEDEENNKRKKILLTGQSSSMPNFVVEKADTLRIRATSIPATKWSPDMLPRRSSMKRPVSNLEKEQGITIVVEDPSDSRVFQDTNNHKDYNTVDKVLGFPDDIIVSNSATFEDNVSSYTRNAVSFSNVDEKRSNLFNDDWERNESSGEGEVEVREIDATSSRASDWLPKRDCVSEDVESIPTSALVYTESTSDSNLDQQKSSQKGVCSGSDAPDDLDQTSIVNFTFVIQIGEINIAIHMEIPKSVVQEESKSKEMDDVKKSKNISLHDKDGNISSLPLLITVRFHQAVDDKGILVFEPVMELHFLEPKSKVAAPPSTIYKSDNSRLPPILNDGKDVPLEYDNNQSDPNIEEIYSNTFPDNRSQSVKREMEIQTDIELGARLFSESITSVSGDEFQFTQSSAGDKLLNLPSPPTDEPSSKTSILCPNPHEASLDDIDHIDMYDDSHLLVLPNETFNNYISCIDPDSDENLETVDLLKKINLANKNLVCDDVRLSAIKAKRVNTIQLSGDELNRWGFPQEVGGDDKSFSENIEFVSSYTDTSCYSLKPVATKVIFQLSNNGFEKLSVDGRTSFYRGQYIVHITALKTPESPPSSAIELNAYTVQSYVMYKLNGEVKSEALLPQSSPLHLNLPFRGDLLIFKYLVPQSEHAGKSQDPLNISRKITIHVTQAGDSSKIQTKILEPGGKPLVFDIPFGQGKGNLKMASKIEAQSSKEDLPELTTKVTVLNESESFNRNVPPQSNTFSIFQEQIRETESLSSIRDGVLGEQIPQYNFYNDLELPPVEKPDVESEFPKTVVHMDKDGILMGNHLIPEKDQTVPRSRPVSRSSDRCFDAVLDALAVYEKEIDPLKKALREIIDKLKELHIPELAGIGEPPVIPYADYNPNEIPSYSHRIILQTSRSRISTAFQSLPNSRDYLPQSRLQYQWQEPFYQPLRTPPSQGGYGYGTQYARGAMMEPDSNRYPGHSIPDYPTSRHAHPPDYWRVRPQPNPIQYIYAPNYDTEYYYMQEQVRNPNQGYQRHGYMDVQPSHLNSRACASTSANRSNSREKFSDHGYGNAPHSR